MGVFLLNKLNVFLGIPVKVNIAIPGLETLHTELGLKNSGLPQPSGPRLWQWPETG